MSNAERLGFILERNTIQVALLSNENDIFKGRLTNGDFKWLVEQTEKYESNKNVVERIVGEETLWQNGEYESEIMKLQAENKRLKAFYNYFSELYGQGLEIANWHQNGELEPFDEFFDSAEQEME